MSSSSRSELARTIYQRHLAFVREINDMHIFVQQAMPLLQDAKAAYEASEHKKDRRYYVPAIGRTKFARRKDRELRNIYDRYLDAGLYETFLVTAISRFESLLADVLRFVLLRYPKKLSISVAEIPPCRSVRVQLLLDADCKENAVDAVIDEHLSSVFYARPQAYLRYLAEISGVDVRNTSFDDYVEMKATRDLILHNSAEINQLYVQKAGKKARGRLGDPVVLDKRYFDRCIATLKRMSGIIERDTNKKFPPREASATDS